MVADGHCYGTPTEQLQQIEVDEKEEANFELLTKETGEFSGCWSEEDDRGEEDEDLDWGEDLDLGEDIDLGGEDEGENGGL